MSAGDGEPLARLMIRVFILFELFLDGIFHGFYTTV